MSKRAATEDDDEMPLYDINDTATYNNWSNKTLRLLGASGNGAFTQRAISEGELDPEIARCENLPNDLTFLAGGKTYEGVVYVNGLTVQQLRTMQPLPPRNQRTETEKTRVAYVRDCATAINFIKLRMADHTIAFFESMESFNDAIRRRDLVLFGQILRTRGIIGTGDVEIARQKLEKEVYEVADHLKLENQGTRGYDFNEHSIQYRRAAKTLKELGSLVGEKQMVRSFVLSLPGKTIKTNLSLTGAPATLEEAITTVRSMIIAQNVSLTECAEAFVLDEDSGGKNKRRKATVENTDSIEMMVATAIARLDEAKSKAKIENDAAKRTKRDTDRGEQFKKNCRSLEKDGFCDYEKKTKAACRFAHGSRISNVGGVIRKIAPRSENK